MVKNKEKKISFHQITWLGLRYEFFEEQNNWQSLYPLYGDANTINVLMISQQNTINYIFFMIHSLMDGLISQFGIPKLQSHQYGPIQVMNLNKITSITCHILHWWITIRGAGIIKTWIIISNYCVAVLIMKWAITASENEMMKKYKLKKPF